MDKMGEYLSGSLVILGLIIFVLGIAYIDWVSLLIGSIAMILGGLFFIVNYKP